MSASLPTAGANVFDFRDDQCVGVPADFICNVADTYKTEEPEFLGEPVASKFLPVDELKRLRVAGLYRRKVAQ